MVHGLRGDAALARAQAVHRRDDDVAAAHDGLEGRGVPDVGPHDVVDEVDECRRHDPAARGDPHRCARRPQERNQRRAEPPGPADDGDHRVAATAARTAASASTGAWSTGSMKNRPVDDQVVADAEDHHADELVRCTVPARAGHRHLEPDDRLVRRVVGGVRLGRGRARCRRRSGTPAKIIAQLRRTCAVPEKPRAGVGGVGQDVVVAEAGDEGVEVVGVGRRDEAVDDVGAGAGSGSRSWCSPEFRYS